MFTILGGDGKEYGPVTAAKVGEWLSGGRATLQTRARRDGETEWKTLGDFPEFAATSAPAGTPAPPPSAPAPAAAALGLDARVARTGTLDITGAIKRGFATGAANFLPLLGVTLLVSLACGVAGAIPILGMIISLTMTGVFYGGLYYYVLKKVRGETTELGDAFSGFTVCFVQLMLATIVCTLLTIVAFVCLILPGIYVAVCWIFTYALVRDKGLEFWDAMELGRRAITRQWFRVFGFLLLVGLMALAVMAVPMGMMISGAAAAQTQGHANLVIMALGIMGMVAVGLLVAPFFLAMLLHAYEDIFSEA